MAKNYYLILGVHPNADLGRIKKAYRQRAKQHHPDVAEKDQSSDKFIEVQEAYRVLSDAKRRRQYDRETNAGGKTGPAESRYPYRRAYAPVDRNRRASASVFRARPFDRREVFLQLLISRRQAQTGADIEVSLPIQTRCRQCLGTGRQWLFLCPGCSGQGTVQRHHEFILQLPPRIAHGTEARLSLADAGLPGLFLRLRILLHAGDVPDPWEQNGPNFG